MTPSSRPLCADLSREAEEPLGATASRIDHWLLVEYPGRWSRDVLGGSTLPVGAKDHLKEQLASLSHARLLFVRRPERRDRASVTCTRSGAGRRRAPRTACRSPRRPISPPSTCPRCLPAPANRSTIRCSSSCTHGKRDRCCSLYGRPLYDALRHDVPPEWVWQSTHVGGDRFAGNLVCLPEGLYFGRVDPAAARGVLSEYLDGRIELEHYRGRSCHSFPQQAAERLVRERTGRRDIDGVRFVSIQREGAHSWIVRFAAGADELEARVVREEGEPAFLTCDAATQRRPRRYVATLR